MAEDLNLDILKGLSADQLKQLMEQARKLKQALTKPVVDDAKMAENLEKLKPLEDAFNVATQRFNELKAQQLALLNAAKDEYKLKVGQAKEFYDKAKALLADKRKELNIAPTRAASAGPQTSWHCKVDIDAMNAVIGKKDDESTWVEIKVEENGKTSLTEIKEKLIKPAGIVDTTGGKGRGIQNRVKTQYLALVQERKGGVAEEGTPAGENEQPAEQPAEQPVE